MKNYSKKEPEKLKKKEMEGRRIIYEYLLHWKANHLTNEKKLENYDLLRLLTTSTQSAELWQKTKYPKFYQNDIK